MVEILLHTSLGRLLTSHQLEIFQYLFDPMGNDLCVM
jgi:hypothetical protein